MLLCLGTAAYFIDKCLDWKEKQTSLAELGYTQDQLMVCPSFLLIFLHLSFSLPFLLSPVPHFLFSSFPLFLFSSFPLFLKSCKQNLGLQVRKCNIKIGGRLVLVKIRLLFGHPTRLSSRPSVAIS